MAQQKLCDEFDELKINDSGPLTKTLVLLIGISKYSHGNFPNLNGVPIDIANYENLWQKDYKYDVLPAKGTKWYNKASWTADEVLKFLRMARKKLFDDEEEALQYQAMIMVYCGHGLDGVIIASDGDKVSINDIHSKFSGAWIKKVTEIPRLFIFDCCRGQMKTGRVGRGNMAHRADNICSLFGNSPGIEVDEDAKGGYFSQCVVECMRKTKNNPKFTITDLSIALLNKLQDKSDQGQTCWKEGDPRVDKKVFNVNEAKKQAQSGLKKNVRVIEGGSSKKHKMYGMNDDDAKSNNANDGHKVKIPLKIYDYNGCLDDDDDCHPKWLLTDNENRWYASKKGVTSGDWIIFQVADIKKHTPKWLKINNWDSAYGIKDIRLLFEYSDNNGFFQYFKSFKWTNEQKITNIHNKNRDDQWFKLDMPSKNKPLNKVKLVIDKNHGWYEFNFFYSFSLFA